MFVMVIDLYGYNMLCERNTENNKTYLKTMNPDGLRLCSIHKLTRRNYISIVAPISWYIWIVMTISYHMGFPFMVLKMGSPGRCWLTLKHPRYVGRLITMKIPRIIRGEAGTENSLVKDIRLLIRYQHDDEVAGSRSLYLCRSSAN